MVVVRAAEAINPEIRKTEDKVVDSVVVTELSKPLTAYCRFLSPFHPLLLLRLYSFLFLYFMVLCVFGLVFAHLDY